MNTPDRVPCYWRVLLLEIMVLPTVQADCSRHNLVDPSLQNFQVAIGVFLRVVEIQLGHVEPNSLFLEIGRIGTLFIFQIGNLGNIGKTELRAFFDIDAEHLLPNIDHQREFV